ncbi:MAG: RsmE family RNA methyltransferase [Planctomycetia bacterium]
MTDGRAFFLSAAPADGRAILGGDEARHLARVLRARVGDTVTLFDGHGRQWAARVTAIGRDEVALEADAARIDPEPPGTLLTLAVALPKGDRQKWMVEKLTALGVHALGPLETTRGVAEAPAAARARLDRSVIEACKQCGRNTLLTINPPRSLAAVLADAPARTRILVAHPGGPPALQPLVPPADAVLALVGPEGGFTAEELSAADAAGAERIGLGPHVLRVETAAVALAARFAV